MKCYEHMPWPQLPAELEASLFEWAKEANSVRRPNAQGKFFDQMESSPELDAWARANLPIDDSYTVILQKFVGIVHCPVHKDNIRNFSYNYVLTDDPAVTVFYSDDAEEVDRITYQSKQWYWHNSKVFHGVQNMSTDRLAVSIFQLIPVEQRPKTPTLLRANLPGAILPKNL
jgi:hypothetical protein